MATLPKKLKHDAILEAIVEIQFDHDLVSEVVIGRLASSEAWAGYQSVRLPFADIPPSIRDADQALRYQAIMQLQRPEPGEIVKIGPRNISLHHLAPYDGWDSFSERVKVLVDVLSQALGTLRISRTSLKYINALTPVHGFETIWDLNLTFEVAGERPPPDFVTVYRSYGEDGVLAQVTVAAPSLVNNLSAARAVALVDIDVSSQSPLGNLPPQDVMRWFEKAHNFEKATFFALWPDGKVDEMREE